MIKRLIIAALLRQLLDPATRQHIVEMVDTLSDMDMSGAQKRDYVVDKLHAWGVTGSSWAINLAIELAVARYRV